jgi:hypothetical protein
MTPQELNQRVSPLYESLVNLATLTDKERPLYLAHYTSLEVLEKIIQSNELWFSNPLFMNDHSEMKGGLFESINVLREIEKDNDVIKAIGGVESFAVVSSAFIRAFQNFDANLSLDVYIFCLSEYDNVNKPDGLLSMWRGYGANGQGAAIVFNTQFISVVPGSPLLIVKVNYANNNKRKEWVESTFRKCLSELNDLNANKELLEFVGFHMFQLALLYSLSSKHPGFEEEQEWRVIYLPDRDDKKLMDAQRTYLRRNNTIEPKLRFPIEPLKIEPRQTWTFDSIVERVVLGPTHFSPSAVNLARRMFVNLGKPSLASKIWVSEIPYRPI